ncbi:serine/threonine-protein kinase [Pyxidicoccus caerfyrddinensis]|uniref:serine/threonine-protein kinase n=1 Tax=Pyxidicoccus caerfyrddinensis TaxID=2709663 RepID=UPI0013DBF51D|nr:serine/threonine-protein kinase [Pyxidicoccus caerfyrddinensis]
MAPGYLNPARLHLGTRVGPWRVLERRGCGAHGAVYRAIGTEGTTAPVALKLALHPRDERFAREAELLSRLHHPNVPRLVGHGEWQDPAGIAYPYLAMEWVEGRSLYDWARQHRPTSRQVLSLLARLAQALEATHAAGGVHRDVKGDNILVRNADGQVFLTDFGSGHYVGAATLSWPPFPPGTPAYRSPEAWRTVMPPAPAPAVPYAPGPADDVFALGVTAWRLVTGEYPPSLGLTVDGARVWSLKGPGPRAPRVLNGRCCVELSNLIARMMSVHPEARGNAHELAGALNEAACEAGPEADVPLFNLEAARPVDVSASSRRVSLQARSGRRRHWSIAAGVGAPLMLGVAWLLSTWPGDAPVSAQVDEKDGGTVAVGDSALTAPLPSNAAPSVWSTIAVDVPPKPLPGQQRPDATGRCPRRGQVSLNGGCWLRLDLAQKDCDENGYTYDGRCYLPVFPPARPATSSPAD